MKRLDELLKEECECNKLPFCGIETYHDSFYEILYGVISKKAHENHPIPEGIIIALSDITVENCTKLKYYHESTSDGERIFSYRVNGQKPGTLVFDIPISQQVLIELVSEKDNHVVIITRKGNQTRVYYDSQISILEDRIWNVTPSLDTILDSLSRIDNGSTLSEMNKLLSFAYYELSLNKIGSTIVFNNGRVINRYYEGGEILNLDFKKKYNKVILKNYLQTHDGAIVMDKKQCVRYGNVFLEYKKSDIRRIDKYEGTRHTSAACFSLAHKNIIAFVVSADGGVSIFKEGKKIEELHYNMSSSGSFLIEWNKLQI